MRFVFILIPIICFVSIFDGVSGDVTLQLLHLSDLHARFEETSIYSGRCSEEDSRANKCYGGFARIYTKLKEFRQKYPNTIFVAAGDYYQGTVWYTIHKWKPLAQFLNLIGQDAMALGNHEFDDGIEGLSPFVDKVNFPVLACNIDDSQEPSIHGKILPSVVLERGGHKIGIIGYVTTETTAIASTGKVIIKDEISSVREEAKRLKQQGVNIIIGVGHVGFEKDLAVAEEVGDIDIVVGGHTNTFLYTGNDPSVEQSVGEYPTIVTQASGKKVPVVQAYAFGKYLGHLEVTFNDQGDLLRWSGNPILLDGSIPQDAMVLEQLKPWRRQLDTIVRESIGRNYVFLDGNRLSCRMKECNLGNLETDAIVHQNAKYPDDTYWARTSLAVMNGGGIRASIDERTSNGDITMEDIMTVAPFQNTIDIVELKGQHVREMFEHSVSLYDPNGLRARGEFLQVSGFQVTYDISKPAGSRVTRLMARCVSCRVPTLEDVVDETVYKIAMPSFIANGGDSFSMIRDNKVRHHLTGFLDTDVFIQYIRLLSPIIQGTERRILFVDPKDPCNGKSFPSSNKTPSATVPSTINLPAEAQMSPVSVVTTTPSAPLPPSLNDYNYEGLADLYDDYYGFDESLAPSAAVSNPWQMPAEEMMKEMMDRHDHSFQLAQNKGHSEAKTPLSKAKPQLIMLQLESKEAKKEDQATVFEDDVEEEEEDHTSLFINTEMEEDFFHPDPEGQKRLYTSVFSQPRRASVESHESFEQHLYLDFAAQAKSRIDAISVQTRHRLSNRKIQGDFDQRSVDESSEMNESDSFSLEDDGDNDESLNSSEELTSRLVVVNAHPKFRSKVLKRKTFVRNIV